MIFKDRSKKSIAEKHSASFISKADKTDDEIKHENGNLDSKATRKKQLGIKVNPYEYKQLEALAGQLDRSIASTMRYASNKVIKEELIKD